MEKEFYTLNVFSERKMSGGNQLGVVMDAHDLSMDQMQMIAKQLNYSESTFITSISSKGATVKIFLPAREIPFAGHPTIGTAYLVEKLWREGNLARNKITLDLKLRPIEVEILGEGQEINMCIMDQFAPEYFGVTENRELVVELLGIDTDDLLDKPILKIAPSDLPFIFVSVKSIDILTRLQPNLQGLIDNFDKIGGEPYVFCMGGEDGGDVSARLFAPKSGIAEDSATGSAQASLALALLKLDLIDTRDGEQSFITEQGYAMNRPCKLYNYISIKDGKLINTRTGGSTYLVSKGILYL